MQLYGYFPLTKMFKHAFLFSLQNFFLFWGWGGAQALYFLVIQFKVQSSCSCLTFWKCLAIYDNIHPDFLTWHSSFSLKKSSPGVFVFYLISFFHANWTIFLLQNLLTNGCKIHDWYSKQYPTFQARNLEIKHNRSLY